MIANVICQVPAGTADVVVIYPGASLTPYATLTGCLPDFSGTLPGPDDLACACRARGSDRPACRAELTYSDSETTLACVASWATYGVAYTQKVWRNGKRVR